MKWNYRLESESYIVEITGGSVRIFDKHAKLIKEHRGHKHMYTGGIRPDESEFFALENGKHFYVYSLKTFDLVKRITLPRTYMFVEYISSKDKECLTVLKPTGTLSSPVDGVSLTGIGYIDGYLHVQVYYENILKTDNHGSIDLINTETGVMLTSFGSISFFDDATMGSYEDYIFAGVAPDVLANYELYGDFTTSSGSVEGNWSITFPLVNTNHE